WARAQPRQPLADRVSGKSGHLRRQRALLAHQLPDARVGDRSGARGAAATHIPRVISTVRARLEATRAPFSRALARPIPCRGMAGHAYSAVPARAHAAGRESRPGAGGAMRFAA